MMHADFEIGCLLSLPAVAGDLSELVALHSPCVAGFAGQGWALAKPPAQFTRRGGRTLSE